MSNWEILRADGKYLGRSMAAGPATAFCDCMITFGLVLNESEVTTEWLQDGSYRIMCRDEVYRLTASP